MSDPTIRCDNCGHFVSHTDLRMGWATRRLITPDSHFTSEKYETLCRPCKARMEAAG